VVKLESPNCKTISKTKQLFTDQPQKSISSFFKNSAYDRDRTTVTAAVNRRVSKWSSTKHRRLTADSNAWS